MLNTSVVIVISLTIRSLLSNVSGGKVGVALVGDEVLGGLLGLLPVSGRDVRSGDQNLSGGRVVERRVPGLGPFPENAQIRNNPYKNCKLMFQPASRECSPSDT